MSRVTNPAKIQLPKSWPTCVRSAMLHVVSLAKYAAVYTRGWAADSPNARVRLKAAKDYAEQDAALLREEMRIKDARMATIAPQRRPYYPPAERMAILELRATRGWSLSRTAEVFLVTGTTVSAWMKRLDETGPDALVQLCTPVNKFPDFVRYAVQRLQALCPSLGKQKIAEILARAGLHLGATTIGRMRKEKPIAPPSVHSRKSESSGRTVTAKRPNHVWHVDLTVIPTQSGFWCPWLPFAFPQRWPFCWWVAVALDHYSRRVMGSAVFRRPPEGAAVRTFLGRAMTAAGTEPKYLISDKGSQFWPSNGYKRWCKRRGIRPRFGAVGQHGSIAVVERLIRTLKEGIRRIVVPLRRDEMRQELLSLVEWYNEFRPHMTLRGRTPNEVYFGRFPANRRPRLEPRPHWPRGSPCAVPQVLVAGQPGDKFVLELRHHDGRLHLPVVKLRRVA
jgi:putative transposase